MTQFVYRFGANQTDGNASMKPLLGGKGANLAEMAQLGLPVPPGMTITTECCASYIAAGNQLPADLMHQVEAAMRGVEVETSREFGGDDPLLLSVRSGAAISMPGMMDTVLNLGLNDETVRKLAEKSGNPRFAWDSYRRFIQMFADVVLGLDSFDFEHMLDEKKLQLGLFEDSQLSAAHLQELATAFKAHVETQTHQPFPQAPKTQLKMAIEAVFKSWSNPRAIAYRQIHDITGLKGTAVTVQAMVFGNRGNTSATGVAFTRDPSTGEAVIYGEYLINAQGEDVVAGIRTPLPLSRAAESANQQGQSMQAMMPALYDEFISLASRLESHYCDMQDIEFTIEEQKLWLLQTRGGKRSAQAAMKLAVAFAEAGTISKKEALSRIEPASIDQMLHPMIDPAAKAQQIGRGLPASPGAACGTIVLTATAAHDAQALGEHVLLVREETSPEDIQGMHAATGILTARGGMTSHAAVVARGMGKPCICGTENLQIDEAAQQITLNGKVYKVGDKLTIDGSKGEIYGGELPMIPPPLSAAFNTLMEWADEHRRLQIRVNAETTEDLHAAIKFGAEGIGLCRTEHMFFAPKRISAIRGYILAEDEALKKKLLAQLTEFQQHDFTEIFRLMEGRPVTIRLLDPPLHEFLPHDEAALQEVAQLTGLTSHALHRRVESLSEVNPMLGHRGCRLGITHPDLYEAQMRAILTAAKAESAVPEIMIPLIISAEELLYFKAMAQRVAQELGNPDYKFGTMIELPAAALIADKLAEIADFFSFGTNDLTQTTLGLSRDDTGALLTRYREQGYMQADPFASLDIPRVGALVKMATEKARKVKPDIKLSICGEHAGDSATIHFCHEIGLDAVSCSPYRLPIARMAAGQCD